MTLLADRLARIDAALNCHRFARYAAEDACHHDEAKAHGAEIDRLLSLRARVELGHGRMVRA